MGGVVCSRHTSETRQGTVRFLPTRVSPGLHPLVGLDQPQELELRESPLPEQGPLHSVVQRVSPKREREYPPPGRVSPGLHQDFPLRQGMWLREAFPQPVPPDQPVPRPGQPEIPSTWSPERESSPPQRPPGRRFPPWADDTW